MPTAKSVIIRLLDNDRFTDNISGLLFYMAGYMPKLTIDSFTEIISELRKDGYNI